MDELTRIITDNEASVDQIKSDQYDETMLQRLDNAVKYLNGNLSYTNTLRTHDHEGNHDPRTYNDGVMMDLLHSIAESQIALVMAVIKQSAK